MDVLRRAADSAVMGPLGAAHGRGRSVHRSARVRHDGEIAAAPSSQTPPVPSPPPLPLAPRWSLTLTFGGFAALFVLGLRLWLEYVGPIPGDRWSWEAFSGSAWNSPLNDLSIFFSVIATPQLAAITVPVIAWFAWRAAGTRAAALVLVAATGVFLNLAIKRLSGPTPEWRAEHPTLWLANYPSGHVVYAVTVFGAAAWLAWGRRRDIAAVLLVLIAAMGPFRVIADAHYLSDVLAGYAVGAAWLLLAGSLTLPHRSVAPAATPPASPGQDAAAAL